ncbi:hybrid sensor histidine kinase/response regulator [Candidatus Magnetominusculus xianensis]|uniref:histidine kinase n=1 Tax=Candidatus Magnetominusculus xianensis TaxID=1748249 RepID=A0ABR5SI34_9BACT|nr:hybrid sensor histidine kinase/response regulator [Candidatus Magnetominusculus xianensis]KWT91951.1 multi-sensor signal transduction histidine kinase [Candidatus Magnetominusculus xianensis]MBF0403224.1 PAS domain S-box protein [Nitrospirota bacterium]
MPKGRFIRCLFVGGSPEDVRYFSEILSGDPHVDFAIENIEDYPMLPDYLSNPPKPIDMLLIDIELSDPYSCQTLISIKKTAGELPVLGISEMENPGAALMAAQCGAQDYIAKSEITGKSLSRSIQYAIERNRLLIALKQSGESRFFRLIEKNADGILILDMEGWIRFANPAAEGLFGKESGQLTGEYLGFPVITADKTEIELISKTGKVAAVEIRIVEIEWEQEPHILASLRDITERKQMLNEITELNKNLERRVIEEVQKCQLQEDMLIQKSKMAAIGEMIGSIAHQWRQPLNGLALIIQDLQDAYKLHLIDDLYIEDTVSSGMNLINFMSDTISDFSNFFKPTKRKIRIDMNMIINSVLTILSSEMRNLKIELKHSCKCSTYEIDLEECKKLTGCDFGYLYITGYPNEIKQVLLNIIINAKDAILEAKSKGLIKAGENGFIAIHTIRNADDITIIIKDNAGGIPPGILDKLFRPYFTTKGNTGTGIGLYMSKTIIESNLGGKLYAENTDKGAAFTIVLPTVASPIE